MSIYLVCTTYLKTVCSAGAKSLLGFMKGDDDAVLSSQFGEKRRVVTYGFGETSDWRAIMLVPNPQGGTDYTVVSRLVH